MANIWIVSDTCFHDNNVLVSNNRPFDTKEQMDEAIIENWNSVVKPEDTVYHLGDVIFGGSRIRESILPRLNGYKILRMGDQDQGVTKHKWQEYFDEVYNDDILYDGKICFSHEPLDEVTLKKLVNNGIIIGNVHAYTVCEDLSSTEQYNVSLDMRKYTPVNLEEIYKFFS